MKDIDYYQEWTETTAIYDDPLYPILGLAEEAGEVAGKYAKYVRDHTSTNALRAELSKELGDVMWMASRIAADMDIKMSDILAHNRDKLMSRQSRGKLSGSGDYR